MNRWLFSFVAGDLDEYEMFDEPESVAICANFGQVRNFLHKKAFGRGFYKQQPPGVRKPHLKALTN